MKFTGVHLIIILLIVLIAFCSYLNVNMGPSGPAVVPMMHVAAPPRRRRVRRSPEFRGPPYKEYKPRQYQQMGLLMGDSGSILPLYGKETNGYRDRYNYYTSTPGQQIYPLPLSFDNRDCTEDIGCPEFYGNESVNVTGMSGENFSVKNYRNIPI